MDCSKLIIMERKDCIIVLTHPNTDNKKKILVETLSRLKQLGLPVFVFANMDIDKSYLKDCDDFVYTGQNPFYCASDFLSISEVIEARRLTKYRSHVRSGETLYTFTPITYGNEKNYFWACNMLYQVAFNYVKNNGYSHFMLSQYDTIIGPEEFPLVHKYFEEMHSKNLDGYFSVDPNMGENHFNGDVFFGNVVWWCDMFNTITPYEFYQMTYPNWTPEEYFYMKCLKKDGKIKIVHRLEREEWEMNYYNNIPETWEKQLVSIDSRRAINTLFPNLSDTGLSNYWDTPTFDVNQSLIVSCVKKEDHFEVFVWFKPIVDESPSINVTIGFSGPQNFTPFSITLSPSQWSVKGFELDPENRKITVDYNYEINNENFNGHKEYYIQ